MSGCFFVLLLLLCNERTKDGMETVIVTMVTETRKEVNNGIVGEE